MPSLLKWKWWKSMWSLKTREYFRESKILLFNLFLIQVQKRIPKYEIQIYYHLQGQLSKFLMVQNFWINLSFDLNPNTVYQRDTIMEAHSCREVSAQIWLQGRTMWGGSVLLLVHGQCTSVLRFWSHKCFQPWRKKKTNLPVTLIQISLQLEQCLLLKNRF